jgi:hypothetical protein
LNSLLFTLIWYKKICFWCCKIYNYKNNWKNVYYRRKFHYFTVFFHVNIYIVQKNSLLSKFSLSKAIDRLRMWTFSIKFKKIAKISIDFRLLALLRLASTGNAISLNATSGLVSSLILFCVKAQMCLLCWHVVHLCVKSSFCPRHSKQSGEYNLPCLYSV